MCTFQHLQNRNNINTYFYHYRIYIKKQMKNYVTKLTFLRKDMQRFSYNVLSVGW